MLSTQKHFIPDATSTLKKSDPVKTLKNDPIRIKTPTSVLSRLKTSKPDPLPTKPPEDSEDDWGDDSFFLDAAESQVPPTHNSIIKVPLKAQPVKVPFKAQPVKVPFKAQPVKEPSDDEFDDLDDDILSQFK